MNGLLTVSTTRVQQTLKRKILNEGYSELFKLMVKGTGLQIATSTEDT